MNKQEERIQDFYHLEPWKYQRITRYIWFLSRTNPIRRDLTFYLGIWTKPFNPFQLKVQCYDVEVQAYSSIYFREKIMLQLRLDERMQYTFEDIFDDTQLLLKCQDFDFQLEQVDDEHL